MAQTFQKLQLAFATPLVTYMIDDAERINAALLKEIDQRRAAEAGMVRSNRSGWHSDLDFFARKEPAHRELAKAIMLSLADATRRIAAKGTDLTKMRLECDGWVNVNPDGGYNVPHDHPGAFWSAAYYVYVPQGREGTPDGAIEFIDHRSAPPGQGLVQSPYHRGLITLKPAAGMLIVFPSTLKHWVHPNRSDEERVTIAINAKVAIDPAKAKEVQQDELKNTLPENPPGPSDVPEVPETQDKAEPPKAKPAGKSRAKVKA